VIALPSPIWYPCSQLMGMFDSVAQGGRIGNTTTIDATNEALHLCGRVCLADRGEGGGRTISSSGGKIHFLSGDSLTWASAGSTLRVGLQDLDTASNPPHGDGTFDVYDDLVQGTDSLSNTTWTSVTMSSGTKTLSHGDLVAVAFTFTTRNGSDAFKLKGMPTTNYGGGMPETSVYTGSWGSTGYLPCHLIEFDDGTFGWIEGTAPLSSDGSLAVLGSSSPDEYGNVFRWPTEIEVDALGGLAWLPNNSSGSFYFKLYEDPFGTPSALASVEIPQYFYTQFGVTNGFFSVVPITPQRLKANTDYVIATDCSALTWTARLLYATIADSAYVNCGLWGDYVGKVGRSNGTGAFSAKDATTLMLQAVRISKVALPALSSYNLGIH